MNDPSGLRSMPLYTHVERIARGLAARGIGPNDAIPTEQLFALDQWHYHGTDAVRDAARFLSLGPTSRVLDIGAGVGGPARFLAHATGCHVTKPGGTIVRPTPPRTAKAPGRRRSCSTPSSTVSIAAAAWAASG